MKRSSGSARAPRAAVDAPSDASSEITIEDRQRAYRDLRSTTCACGARKTARQSLCRRHYFALPGGMRHALYDVDLYPSVYKRALEYLKLTGEPKEAA